MQVSCDLGVTHHIRGVSAETVIPLIGRDANEAPMPRG
jgi:hypothetical protein